ncbi:MAG: DUF4197 family protein, partial [Lewinella sp.]|nr:DUF4197 family protein [Lewinella sp.]
MKKLRFLVLLTLLAACTPQELQNALGTLTGSGQLTSAEIGSGLKQALEFGISEGAQKLAEKDGYFKSQYKILLPAEARKVTDKLQNIPG